MKIQRFVIMVLVLGLLLPAPGFIQPVETSVASPSPMAANSPSTFTAVAAGGDHTCAVTTGGGLKCWGNNGDGQLGDGTFIDRHVPVAVDGLTNDVTAPVTGYNHTCVLIVAGRVQCWGDNRFGQLGDGTTNGSVIPVDVIGLASDVTALAAGGAYTCVLTVAGKVQCWGANLQGQLGDGTTNGSATPVDVIGLEGGITALAAGSAHTCAVTRGGKAKCWGDNFQGQLGDGTTDDHSTPVDVIELASNVTALAASEDHTCALTADGGVKCWGANWQGQLGDGTTNGSATPVDVIGLESDVTVLAAGGAYTCALTNSGRVKCWGYGYGRTPVDVDGLGSGVTALAAGVGHTCALTTAGRVKCWGANLDGQRGDGTYISHNTPVVVRGLASGVTALAAGGRHTCVVTATSRMRCWGNNGRGQLGDGTIIESHTPVDVAGLTSGVTALAAGGSYTCAVTSDGGVQCWGANGRGQLGDGTITDSRTPVDVAGLASGVTVLTAPSGSFGAHTCALTADSGVKCWGANLDGQLGDGTTSDRHTPVDVIGLESGVTALVAGANYFGAHTCALTGDGGVECWGANDSGQLGAGTFIAPGTPVGVIGLASGVTALAAGPRHTCAATTDGRSKCWGDGSNTPVDVVGLTSEVTALAAGGYDFSGHTCALAVDGGVVCWGANGSGQLGDGTNIDRPMPVAVSGLAGGVTALVAGGDHTCALVTGGRAKCWGSNEYGQLGTGPVTKRTTPVGVVTGGRLSVSYVTGRPGSYFTLTGEYFPPSSVLTITVNHAVSTTLQTNRRGWFILFLDTAVADEGGYLVTADANPKASVFFTLDEAAPLRPQEGGGQTLVIPAGMAGQYRSVYLPMVTQ